MNIMYSPKAYGGHNWARRNPRLLGVLVFIFCISLLAVFDTDHRQTVTRHVFKYVGAQQPVVFAIIMYGLGSAEEGHVFLKSAMMHTSVPLEFHIITDTAGQGYIEERMRLVSRPLHDIKVVFYPLSKKAMEHRLDRTGEPNANGEVMGILRTDHWGGYAGMMKLFLHEILPTTVKRAIFVDTDAIIVSDPALMWRQFDKFTRDTAAAIPMHDSAERPVMSQKWRGGSRICSCVLMLDLERMREEIFMTSTLFPARMRRRSIGPPAIKAWWGEAQGGHPPGKYYEHVGLGVSRTPPRPDDMHNWTDTNQQDQGYWYALKEYSPHIFQPLHLGWEVTTCIWNQYNVGLHGSDNMTVAEHIASQANLEKTPDEGKLLIPYLLHL
ncbi:hypothetical protein HGRIS_014276 [Hohenbuehelia grisea]|uniref:Glycosyltransferase family 8 protein n=1 Tax=Hohenbuehelia grisea TaxID=104357 RepID=A0ABR3JT09_9AGAR